MKHRRLARLGVVLAILLTGTACSTPEVGMERGAELFDGCRPCHGPEGAGNREFGAPPIGGLPAWYVEGQLEKFQNGLRGAHPDDLPGLRMRGMARMLSHEGDIESVAAYVASLTPAAPEDVLDGAPSRGQTVFQVCTACHGADLAGNEQVGAPPLRSQSDWYMVAQLRKFKDGLRGARAGDMSGNVMRPIASQLDTEEMLDVVAYIETLRAGEAP